MSCKNVNFPINVLIKNKLGECSKSCNLEFLYKPSSCVCTNKEYYLSFTYDKQQYPPVLFNNKYYDVTEIRLYTPSLNLYENNYSDGELLIIHKGVKDKNDNFLICLPIKINDSETSIMNDIIDRATTFVTNVDDVADLNVNFNLNSFVPISPFVYFKGKVPFDCTQDYNICIFGNKKHYISVSSDKINSLKLIIKNQNYFINDGVRYKINNSFKLNSNSEIKCFPLPSSKEGFVNNDNINDLISTNNDYNLIIIGILGFSSLIYLILASKK